ncbi:MAG: hypothetical protein ACFFCM_22470 [Promethearchaeota archaeon]
MEPEIYICTDGMIIIDHDRKTITFYDDSLTHIFKMDMTTEECFEENNFRKYMYIQRKFNVF